VLAAARETDAIFTLEEHSILGGLGSAVAETLAESRLHVWFKRLGIPPNFTSVVGSHEYLKQTYLLSVEGIVKQIASSLCCWGLSNSDAELSCGAAAARVS